MSLLVPLVVVGVAGVLLLLLLAMGPRVFPGTRPLRRSFWCPFRQRPVSVDFRETVWDGTLVDVERCTAFTPPHAVRCDKRCLEMEGARAE